MREIEHYVNVAYKFYVSTYVLLVSRTKAHHTILNGWTIVYLSNVGIPRVTRSLVSRSLLDIIETGKTIELATALPYVPVTHTLLH